VCGDDPAGAVVFSDFSPDWREPVNGEGVPIVGWANQLGVTAPPGVGLFCKRHLSAARRLRRLTALEAVGRLERRRVFIRARWPPLTLRRRKG
jgi:hypothetical protein